MAAVKKPARARQPVTRRGTPLSGEYEEAWYTKPRTDSIPPSLSAVGRAGRPSRGARASTRLGVRLDDDTYQSIRRLAEHQHRNISDVVREAINRYLEAS